MATFEQTYVWHGTHHESLYVCPESLRQRGWILRQKYTLAAETDAAVVVVPADEMKEILKWLPM